MGTLSSPSLGRTERWIDWDPRLVVVMALCLLIACKSLALPWELALLQAALISIMLVAKLNGPLILLRSLMVLPFTLAALPLLFSVEGAPLFEVWGWTASQQGLERYLLIGAHCWLSYQTLLIATTLTGPYHFIHAMGRLGLPQRLVAMLSLALRYLQLLVEEATRMNRARYCRSGGGGASLRERFKTTGQMVGSLFLRTLDRADRVQVAMRCRGNGKPYLAPSRTSITSPQWLALIATLLSTSWIVFSRA